MKRRIRKVTVSRDESLALDTQKRHMHHDSDVIYRKQESLEFQDKQLAEEQDGLERKIREVKRNRRLITAQLLGVRAVLNTRK